jgi:hypothetical protein
MMTRAAIVFLVLSGFSLLLPGSSRRLVAEEFECSQVLATWTPQEIAANIETSIERSNETTASDAQLFRLVVLPQFQYAVQVRKICASCTDVARMVGGDPSLSTEAFSQFCGPNVYGHNVTFSALLMLPLSGPENDSILPGTLKSVIYTRVTTRTSESLSRDWAALNLEVTSSMGIVSATGAAFILPDFMGYGESMGKVSRAFVIRKSYQTSSIPLWLEAGRILRDETNCASALSHSAVVYGYSEGGYAATAVAQALDSFGVDMILLGAGGGPYRASTALFLGFVNRVDTGIFPLTSRYMLALLGSAYSSTYPDVVNYGVPGQSVLSDASQAALVELVTMGADKTELNSAIPNDDVFSVLSADFVSFFRDAVARGETDPCTQTGDYSLDELCAALKENDLNQFLVEATFPIHICHSTVRNTARRTMGVIFDFNSLCPFRSCHRKTMLSSLRIHQTFPRIQSFQA